MTTDERLDQLGLGDGVWNFEACRQRLRQATTTVVEAEDRYKQAIERSADAEAVYRAKVAEAFAGYRESGQAVEAATTLARRDVAVLGRGEASAAGLVRRRPDKLKARGDGRGSVWRLIEG